ncbi:hypothetical protein BMS3Abin07_02332 [bacterium BMS3Abin07]|nr:hypothetical protein BMS3Abin07_02332 [bacterium BMS3Abin07]GBE31297.1 hypothetical protein BMS3Bbin05_00197 [bacterium BMS3Bbin05]HDO22158.1 hypothetical protein [Nitrospirota bacterium]HDZ88302.1 hypothetical protein [Nitrospirota bacterium]
MKRSGLFVFLLFISLSLYFPGVLFAEVIVHDGIAVSGRPVTLEAETGSGFFRRGGELVEFFIDGKSIGKNLSGGDGLAYKETIPGTAGLMKISAESGKDRGEGLLLVLKKKAEIVFIDVEGSIMDKEYLMRPREGSRKAIENISKRFPVVLIQTGILGIRLTKKWLKENGFQKIPLLPWEDGAVFEEVKEKGLKVKAVIGSQRVIDSAEELKPVAFSFGKEVEGAKTVGKWNEIEKRLK